MDKPIVSVIIPTYNRSDFLVSAIHSVQIQTYADLEILVIDDGSSDNTFEIVSKIAALDTRIKYFYQKNKGLSSARNYGIRISNGDYLAFLDSDDLWHYQKIERQVKILLSDDNVDAVYVNFININLYGEDLGKNTPYDDHRIINYSLYEKLLYYCAIVGSGSSVIAKKESIIKTGYFDEKLCSAEDWDFWRRMALFSNFYFLDENLVYIRRHYKNMSQDLLRRWKGENYHLKKMYVETPQEFRSHLPESAYGTYKKFLKSFHLKKDFISFFLVILILLKILFLGKKYIIRFFQESFHYLFKSKIAS